MTEKICENCIHRKGIVCDLDGGHIDFTSWCDYFEGEVEE